MLSPDRSIALALASGAAGMVGVFLDTAWHRSLGRDSFFMLPHLFIYGGGLGILVASLAAIAGATRSGAEDIAGPILHVGRVRFPFGFSLTALGMLIVIGAAPVDAWWHSRYGKDVLIWSPPHLQLHFGAGVAAIGMLFAVAAQAGRGWFRSRWVWRAAMLAVFVDMIHRGLFVLAHYTMIPESRTPDFYPFLASLLLPMVLVASSRSLGPWAPTAASILFLAVAVGIDGLLRAIDFDRYTITPLVVIPALALTVIAWLTARKGGHPWSAVVSGLVFALVFTGMETLWMARVVGRAWGWERVLTGLPRSLVAGAMSAYVGWALGGFLRAVETVGGVAAVFGSRRRAQRAASVALALAVVGLVSTYHPQRFGPPMTVEELRLGPLEAFRHQEAVFWEVLLQDEWWTTPRLEARSEGIIDGFPLPIGPAWCARSGEALATDLASIRFSLQINGGPVDLSPYPIVRAQSREGAHCGWVGVASGFQRASKNQFLYTVEFTGPVATSVGRERSVINVSVVFKEP